MDLTAQEIREINERLDREWDIDRLLLLLCGGGVLLGTLLGRYHSPRWHGLTLVAGAWALLDALSGWSPPRWLLHRVGVRRRVDIERERYVSLFGQEPPTEDE